MQRQQQHREGSELKGEDKELDELAMGECLHTREEEDCSDNPEDEEDEDIRPAKRQRLPSPLNDKGLEDRGQKGAKRDITQPRRSLSTATERGHVQPKIVHTRARNSTANEQLLRDSDEMSTRAFYNLTTGQIGGLRIQDWIPDN
ncbi:hypothetical protein B0O99DRAFT_350525 [Bisporella sp. PMI_857]|nr:hypothetical protein B0O99DRAFT_350525 [Bisporella sp. PMI_857]